MTVVDSAVKFVLVKVASKGWPRLTKESAKLPWLRVDFDHLYSFGDDSDSSWTEEEDDNSQLPPKSGNAKRGRRSKMDLEEEDDDDDDGLDLQSKARRRMIKEQIKRVKEEIDVLENSCKFNCV